MNLKQANRCVKLASFLETLDKSKWNYGTFGEISKVDACVIINNGNVQLKKLDCGTCGCALGWCPTVFPNKFSTNLDKVIKSTISNEHLSVDDIEYLQETSFDVYVKDNDGEWVDVSGANSDSLLVDFFGITYDEVVHLFMAHDMRDFYGVNYMSDVTPQMVANKLYDIVKQYGYNVQTVK